MALPRLAERAVDAARVTATLGAQVAGAGASIARSTARGLFGRLEHVGGLRGEPHPYEGRPAGRVTGEPLESRAVGGVSDDETLAALAEEEEAAALDDDDLLAGPGGRAILDDEIGAGPDDDLEAPELEPEPPLEEADDAAAAAPAEPGSPVEGARPGAAWDEPAPPVERAGRGAAPGEGAAPPVEVTGPGAAPGEGAAPPVEGPDPGAASAEVAPVDDAGPRPSPPAAADEAPIGDGAAVEDQARPGVAVPERAGARSDDATARAAAPASDATPPAPPVEGHVDAGVEVVAELAESGAEEGAGAEVEVAEPWSGYAGMTAAEIRRRLARADAAAVTAVLLYERAHRGRKSVLEAAERRLARTRAGS